MHLTVVVDAPNLIVFWPVVEDVPLVVVAMMQAVRCEETSVPPASGPEAAIPAFGFAAVTPAFVLEAIYCQWH